MADVPLRRPGTTTAIWVTRIVLIGVLVLILSLLAKGGMFQGFNASSEQVRMPVSRARIVPGQTIEPSHIVYVDIPMTDLKEEYLLDEKRIVGRVAKQEIPERKAFRDAWLHPVDGQPVKPPKAAQPVTAIKPGWVVVTIDTAKVDAPFDLLQPGTHVVVLATRDGDGENAKVTVVTRKAQIMSAALPAAAPRRGAPVADSGVILQMPAEEAVKFVQVQRTSSFTLVIVNPGQEDELKLPGDGEFNPKDSVEVIRGNKRTFEVPGKRPEGNEPE